ncbi:MAG: glycine zipper 2TM domain-containing protein [Alphaproteobacteria bacterium]
MSDYMRGTPKALDEFHVSPVDNTYIENFGIGYGNRSASDNLVLPAGVHVESYTLSGHYTGVGDKFTKGGAINLQLNSGGEITLELDKRFATFGNPKNEHRDGPRLTFEGSGNPDGSQTVSLEVIGNKMRPATWPEKDASQPYYAGYVDARGYNSGYTTITPVGGAHHGNNLDACTKAGIAGAVIGGAIGNHVGGNKGKDTEGTVIGAIGGAVAGKIICEASQNGESTGGKAPEQPVEQPEAKTSDAPVVEEKDTTTDNTQTTPDGTEAEQESCAKESIIGAVIGGGLGNLIGGKKGHDTEGTVIGAVGGAVIGNEACKSQQKSEGEAPKADDKVGFNSEANPDESIEGIVKSIGADNPAVVAGIDNDLTAANDANFKITA